MHSISFNDFFPIPYYLNNFSDISALALFGAGKQLIFVKTILRAVLRPGQVHFEYLTPVKIPEVSCRDANCRSAGFVIKQEEAQFEVFEVNLIADQLGAGII